MAEANNTSDVIIPLTVDTGGADQSIDDLDNKVEALVATLATLTTANAEYYKIQAEIIQATNAQTAANEKFDKALESVSAASVKMSDDTKIMSDNLTAAAQGTTSLSDDLNNLHTNFNQSGESAKVAAQGTEWYKQTLEALRSEGGLTNVTLNELKATEKDLKKAMADAKPDSEEWRKYRDDLNDVKQAQVDYKVLARDTEGEMKAQTNTIAGMRAEVRQLTKAWANTDMADPKFKELSNNLAEATEKLKEQEFAVGNHRRNVGNYAGQIGNLAKEMGFLGSSANVVTGGIAKADTAFKTLLANPIILFIAAIVTILLKLKSALKSSEEATQRLNAIFAPLKRAAEELTNVFQILVGWILSSIEAFVKLTNSVSRLLEKIPLVGKYVKQANEARAESIQLEEDKYALDQKTREIQIENAKNERDIAEFRAKAAEKEKYTAEERLKFIREAAKLEKANADASLAIAKERLRIAELEAARSQNSKEAEEKIAQLRADVYKAEQDHFNAMQGLNKKESAFIKEIESERKATDDAAKKRRDEAIVAERKAAEELAGVQAQITESLSSEFDNRRSAEEKSYAQRRAILVKNNQSTEELERLHQQTLTQIDKDEAAKRSRDESDALTARLAAADAAYKAEQSAEAIRKAENVARRTEAFAALAAAEAANDEALRTAALARLEEYRIADEEAETIQREKEADELNNRLLLLQEGLANEQVIGDERIALEQQVLAAKNALALNAAATTKAAADKELAEYKAQIAARKKLDDEAAKNKQKTQATINAAIQSGINVASEGAVAAKILNTSQAVMSTWAGAAQALNNPFPFNLAAMTATLTSGFMSIKKIWEVKVPGASGDSAGVMPDLVAPNIEAQATYQAPIVETHSNITGDEIDDITQSQRVYVVESDISATQRRVQVVDSESTF